MRFSGNSIFQRAERSIASTDEPIHINLCAIKRKFNLRGHHEAIFVKNLFRNIFFVRWSKKKLGFFFNRLPFCYPVVFQKTKNYKAPQIYSSLIILNPFLFQMNWQGWGAPRADQNTPCMALFDGSWSRHFGFFFLIKLKFTLYW